MIRRGFWVLAGAAGGIMGYRRASALSRQVSQALGARPKKPDAVKRHWTRETIRFTRDVREGMDLYLARPPAPAGFTTLATDGTLTTDRSTNFEPKDGH